MFLSQATDNSFWEGRDTPWYSNTPLSLSLLDLVSASPCIKRPSSNKISIYCHSAMHCKFYIHCQGLYSQKWNTLSIVHKASVWGPLDCKYTVTRTNSCSNLNYADTEGLCTLILCHFSFGMSNYMISRKKDDYTFMILLPA